MKSDDGEHIYLIDHAWTFKTDQARQNLKNIPGNKINKNLRIFKFLCFFLIGSSFTLFTY